MTELVLHTNPGKKSEVHRTSKGKQGSQPPVPHLGETGEVEKVRHLKTMSHNASQTKESIRLAAYDAPVTSVTKREQYKEEREQELAECRKRCRIIPGQMAVLKDLSSQLVEQPWKKWTAEEREKEFEEWV